MSTSVTGEVMLGTAAEDKTGKPTAEAVPAVLPLDPLTGSGWHRLAYRQRRAKPNHRRSTVTAEVEVTATPTVPAVLGNPQPETEHDPNTKYNDKILY